MDLPMELKDGLSSKKFPSITVMIGVYFYRVCHWGPCRLMLALRELYQKRGIEKKPKLKLQVIAIEPKYQSFGLECK